MWDPPGPGLEPVSPALAGGFLTTVPPAKSQTNYLNRCNAVVPDLLIHSTDICPLYAMNCSGYWGRSKEYNKEILSALLELTF